MAYRHVFKIFHGIKQFLRHPMDIGAIFDPYLDQTLQLRKAAGKIFKFREANQVEILGIGKF